MNSMPSLYKKIVLLFSLFIPSLVMLGETKEAPASAFNDHDLVRYVLVAIIALFVFLIIMLSQAVKAANSNYLDRWRKSKTGKAGMMLILFSLLPQLLRAATPEVNWSYEVINNWDLYLFLFILVLLFIVVLVLVRVLFILMGIKGKQAVEGTMMEGMKTRTRSFFQRFNETVPIEEEDSLDLAHNYDGIRELDNKVPSWWSWAFIGCIAFSFVYMYQMFGSGSIPSQYTELAAQYEEAEKDKAAYLKLAANAIDENNVTMLKDGDLAAGSAIYTKNCVACHGDKGQGGVGPNLTDAYWIHKGGIKEIFYSVKYGWPEKGMKSWKDEMSPQQMAQVSSFVRTLAGTQPPNPKEPQGDLYTEVADSSSTPKPITDSVSK
jgi:cytochrome c oxidase cbb3-type subunit 3